VDASDTLRAIDITSGVFVSVGVLSLPEASNKLFVGGGIAYVGTVAVTNQGFMTVDVSHPTTLRLISDVDAANIIGQALAANGSGILVTAGTILTAEGFDNAVDVINISDLTNTANFITRFTLPEAPFDLAIGAGIAFVADGTGGLQVVNYLSFDNQGVAPIVAATLEAVDLDLLTPGIQVLEGSQIIVRPTVADDVQVRNVELLQNGLVVRNDVSFPFEMSTVLPTIVANGSNQVTLQVRATDTGGNFGLSTPITVQLVPDTFGPTVVASNIGEGAIFGQSFRSVVLTFSEAIDPAALSSTSIQLINSGGNAISAQNIQFRQSGKQVQLTFAQLPVDNYTLRINKTQVKDRVGNTMGVGVLDTHFTIQQFSVEWISDAGGDWNDAANWSTGIVPIATDDVFIGITSSPVTISAGTVIIQSLISNTALTLSGGTLTLNGDSQINGAFTFSGGMLDGTGNVTLNGPVTITNGDMRGTGNTILTGATTISGSGFTMDGGRVLTNAGTVSWTAGFIELNDSAQAGAGTIRNLVGATWLDSGTVAKTMRSVFGSTADNALALFNNAGTYTKSGTGTSTIDANMTNTGTLSVSGGTLDFSAFTITHSAASTLTVEAGATLSNSGSTQVLTGGTVTVAGTFSITGFSAELNVAAAQVLNGTGTLVLANGALTGISTLTVNMNATLSGVDLQDAGTLLLTGATTVSGAGFTMDGGRVLTNSGTVSWIAGFIELNGSALAGAGTIQNLVGATWLDSGTVGKTMRSIFGSAADNALALFNNAGTYTKSGTGTSMLGVNVTDTGTLTVSGGTLDFSAFTATHSAASTITVGDGATLSNSGSTQVLTGGTVTVAGTLSMAGSFAELNVAAAQTIAGTGTLVLANGALTGISTLTVNMTTTLSGVDLQDAGTLLLNGATTISGTGFTMDGGRVLTNSGTVTWTAGFIELNNSTLAGAGTIHNLVGATWLDSGTSSKSMRSVFGSTADNALALFNNAGIYTKSGTGTTSIGVNLSDTGTLTVSGGTLDFSAFTATHSAASTLTVGDGATLSNSGSTQVLTGGTVNVAGTFSMTGSFAELNVAAAQTINGTGTLVLASGTLTGTPTLTVNIASNITLVHMQDAGTTLLTGATTISGAGLTMDGGRVLTNSGTVTWTAGTIELNNSAQAGAGTIHNLVGATWLDSGTGSKLMRSVFGSAADNALALFNNAGTYAKSGTGTTNLAVPVLQSGTISVQTGTLQFTGATVLTNAGAIAVKAGALASVTGGYSQTAGGSLSIEVGGLLTSQFGRLTATGAATLDGTLNVALVNGFTPALNDRFRFLTDASRTGFFATTNGLDIGGGLAFQVETTDPLDLELVTVAAAPASATVQSDATPTSDVSLVSQPEAGEVLSPMLSLPSEAVVEELDTMALTAASSSDLLTNLASFQLNQEFQEFAGRGMTAVVIDTGIDVDHPFFGPDADLNGVADRIVFQWDFADHDADASDRVGHGSHIASLIGSQDATYQGVAPDTNLIALKVFSDTGTGTFAFVEQALQWVVAHALEYSIDVVNLSLGDGQNWTTPDSHYGLGDEFATLANDGIIVVAAAGNNFFTARSQPGVAYPAADPNVIGVGAVWTQDFGGPWRWSSGATDLTTGADRIASFSQRDATMTEIFAPGARLTGANQLGGTVTMQGTSQAAAYLSGTALLAQQIAEDELGRALTPQEFTTLLMASGQRIVDGDNEQDNVTNTGLTFPRVDMVALADAILALRPERHDHQWEEHPGRGVELALAHRSATGDQHAQGPRFSMPRSGENGHVEHPCADWDSLGDESAGTMLLAQGYTQQAWVRDFVGGVGSVTNATDEEELLIALPG